MSKPITIILSGAPGRMCREIAALMQAEAMRGRFVMAPFAFASEARRGTMLDLCDGLRVSAESVGYLESVVARHQLSRPIVIDYTSPAAALDNVAAYASAGLPFVMGTTGFDRERAVALVNKSPASAVIAPNMAAPIVLIQTALADLARRFPHALSGYTLGIEESHQATKKDVSGTARALLPHLQALGGVADDDPIRSIRGPREQRDLGVPEEHLAGHAWHSYDLRSDSDGVHLRLTHNINGRRVYAEGSLRAAAFLARKVDVGAVGNVYTMTDVLAG